MTTAFVLGGGGVLGAHEVGMLQALAEAESGPTSWSAPRSAPSTARSWPRIPVGAAGRLSELWKGAHLQRAFSGTLLGRAARLARSGTHLHAISRCGGCWMTRFRRRTSPTCSCRSTAWPPASSGPAPGGSPAARWSRPCWPRARCPACCRRWRSTVSTTSTAAWSTRSRSGAPSSWAPGPCTCCMSGGSSARWPRRNGSGGGAGRLRDRPPAPLPREVSSLQDDVTVHVLPSGATPRPPDLAQLRYRNKTDVGCEY